MAVFKLILPFHRIADLGLETEIHRLQYSWQSEVHTRRIKTLLAGYNFRVGLVIHFTDQGCVNTLHWLLATWQNQVLCLCYSTRASLPLHVILSTKDSKRNRIVMPSCGGA